MPLPAAWVEHLFAKLSVRYGSAFQRQWGDADPALVKADWAEVLHGASGASISYAIEYLPPTPPNAVQFRNLCRGAPLPAPVAITDKTPVDLEFAKAVKARLEAAKPPPSSMTPAQQCAAGLRQRMADGMKLTEAQRSMLAACESMSSGASA